QQFLDDYRLSADDKYINAIDGNRLADAICAIISSESEWVGSASELHEELQRHTTSRASKDLEWMPGNARALSQELRRLAPALRRGGINVDWIGKDPQTRIKQIRIGRGEEKNDDERT
ncbi:MAG: hypothetical protein ACOC0A_01745, partial [Planctomycetota bacterium]